MGRSSWFDYERRSAYQKLYGHLSILIQWEGGSLQIPYMEVLLSKKRLSEITRMAAKCGGWKLIDTTKGE